MGYALIGAVNFVRAAASGPGDRRRIAARLGTPGENAAARPASAASASAKGGRPPALSLEGIRVSFGPSVILRSADLTVAPGELVALVGGNGAGKSTLLRVAAGLLTPESGRASVAGEDVSELLPEERAAAGLAFVSGARPVFPDLTVLENLRVAAFRTHMTHRSFEAATAAVLDLVPALERRRDSKAGVLSGGEQRLLAVAQSLYRRPKVLLADELSLGLAADARVAVMDLLRMLADGGVCVVVVDHDLPSLLSRADRAALLSSGSITDFTPAARVLEGRADLLPATFLAEAAL
jgi:ABC-type branched-subunit amino acid transport system ATPase component